MFVLWGHKLAPTILTSVKFVFLLDSLILKKILFDKPKTWPGSAIGIQTLYGHGLRNQYTGILEFLNVTFHFVILLSLSFVLPKTLLCF